MPDDNFIKIRPYQPSDRAAVRHIAFATSFLEQPGEFFDDEEILADILTVYFTDYEPASSFVAEDDGKVVGYLTGTVNSQHMDRVVLTKIGPAILRKSFRRGTLGRGKIARFLWNIFVSFCRGEFVMRDFSREYPATLHINLLREYRGQRTGERLVAAFENYLRDQKIGGVRASTFSEGAKEFFMKVGLVPLITMRRSFFRYRTGQDVNVYVLGKKLG